jgi:prepilin-type N-terminal cleavage/methylation domain-containing protein
MGSLRIESRGEGQRGVTLIELAVALAVIGVALSVAVTQFADWNQNQRAKAAAREVADLLVKARAEATRTGNRHVVYFGNPGLVDPSNNAVQLAGAWVPVLAIDDGTPAASNCAIDAAEPVDAVRPEDGISWGVSFASAPVGTDDGDAPFNPGGVWDGATFSAPNNAKVNWVLFRPDGAPVTFVGAIGSCGAVGNVGGGGGALYLTNGERDFAVVLSPLGGVRVHAWNRASGAWTS